MHPPLEGVIHLACPHRFVELAHTVVRLLTVCPVNQNMDSNQHNICHITQLHINGNLLESVMLCYIPLTNLVSRSVLQITARLFPRRFMAKARSARAINQRGKQGSVINSADLETRLVRYLLYLFILKKSARKQRAVLCNTAR